MSFWDRWTKPWVHGDAKRVRREYDAYEPLAMGVDRGDAEAIRSIEAVFFGFVNELRDPKRLVGAAAELEQEPRWLELAARHRRGPCELGACALLDAQPREVVAALIERHPLPGPPVALTDATLLLSYRESASHHEERGRVATQMEAIERIAGRRVPVVLEAFWRVVGAIDWRPEEDAHLPGWALDADVEVIDPLCVDGVDVAWESVSEWSEDRERLKHPDLAGAPRVWIAPDRFHKMGISGGESYEVELDGSVDPRVLHAPEDLRLLPYLRNAMKWGGMPGMAY